jgi:hypothetical protein
MRASAAMVVGKDVVVSATVGVSFRGRSFWARDVSLSIFAYEILSLRPDTTDKEWLSDVLRELSVVGRLGADFGLNLDLLDPPLNDEQAGILICIVRHAVRRLELRRTITDAEAATMVFEPDRSVGFEPDCRVIWRSEDEVSTAPIVELGNALIKLLDGTLPQPPKGTWWAFGWKDFRTIQMRTSGAGFTG